MFEKVTERLKRGVVDKVSLVLEEVRRIVIPDPQEHEDHIVFLFEKLDSSFSSGSCLRNILTKAVTGSSISAHNDDSVASRSAVRGGEHGSSYVVERSGHVGGSEDRREPAYFRGEHTRVGRQGRSQIDVGADRLEPDVRVGGNVQRTCELEVDLSGCFLRHVDKLSKVDDEVGKVPQVVHDDFARFNVDLWLHTGRAVDHPDDVHERWAVASRRGRRGTLSR